MVLSPEPELQRPTAVVHVGDASPRMFRRDFVATAILYRWYCEGPPTARGPRTDGWPPRYKRYKIGLLRNTHHTMAGQNIGGAPTGAPADAIPRFPVAPALAPHDDE